MYLNFENFSVEIQLKEKIFQITSDLPGVGAFVKDASIRAETLEHVPLSESDFKSVKDETLVELESLTWKRTYSEGPVATPELILGFQLTAGRVRFFCLGRAYVTISGLFCWGQDAEHNTFSVRVDSQNPCLRTASGPAVFNGDNALFDRSSDKLLIYSTSGDLHTEFDWERNAYSFRYVNGFDYGRELDFYIRENYCAGKFHIPYAPISKKHGFETPPVGWMTWYAVQFKASENIVLENARKFQELFGKYTDKPVLWVDWEWCHRSFDGQGEDGADIFHPRRSAYPNGLKSAADQIREMGLIPALWIGATNEGKLNQMLQDHPEWVLGKLTLWCGQWWVDPSHPGVVNEYIPAVFRQVLDWGFRVVKWDCLPTTLQACSELHDRFFDRSVSPAAGFRNIVKAARKVLGDQVYLLACAGDSERNICGAMDYFDAARIGGDIFSWDDFMEQGINRVLHCYPWHNTVFYADADNLVLRSEFNTPEQARTRVSFYGLAGLPVTIGDELSQLDPARIEMLRRIMPVMDIHPSELDSKRHGRYFMITNLAIARPFGSWNVAGVSNLTLEHRTVRVDLQKDLDLFPQPYAVYDYWNGKYLGLHAKTFEFELAPYDTKVFRITPVNGNQPELISVSRHLTQGGIELQSLYRTGKEIGGTVCCIADDPCRLTILLPEGFGEICCNHPFVRNGQIVEITLTASESAPISWILSQKSQFQKS